MSRLEEIAIKYQRIKIGKDLFLLVPIELIEGHSVSTIFYSIEEYKVLESKESLEENDFLVDNISNVRDLCCIYEYDDPEFVKTYFFEEEKDKAIVVDTSQNRIRKVTIDINMFRKQNIEETYQISQSQPSVILNESSITRLLNLEGIEAIRAELERYKKSVCNFAQKNALIV